MCSFSLHRHTSALCNIQSESVKNEKLPFGFKSFEIVIKTESTLESVQDTLLVVRGTIPYVRCLEAPTIHASEKSRFDLDETSLNPDYPLLMAYTLHNGVAVAQGRSSIWKLLPVLCANGNAISSLIMQRFQ